MNRRMVLRIVGFVLLIEAGAMVVPLLLSIFFREPDALRGFTTAIVFCLAAFGMLYSIPLKRRSLYSAEGYVITALSWVTISAFGALPFYFSGAVPNYFDALFETVSGFTTTGATILNDIEANAKSLLYWRSFTHWLGGMGVLVFLLAIVSGSKNRGNAAEGNMFYLMRAESPGYDVGKMTPRLQKTATTLYLIYVVMTLIQVIILQLGGMPVFDSFCIAYGTAGTGGFGVTNNGLAAYNTFCQGVCTVFMLLFGVNFTLYYYVLTKQWREIRRNEELWAYLGLFLGASLIISCFITKELGGFLPAFHHAAFQVSSIMTTTGFNTVDFNLWPQMCRTIIVLLMIIGASAGSTGGGIKVSRLLIALKSLTRESNKIIHPRGVRHVRLNQRPLDERVVAGVFLFLIAYLLLLCGSVILVSVDGYSLETNLTAVISCLSNIGPGLDMVGPVSNFSIYSNFSTFILTLDMLLGRLEIFPMLILFFPPVWRRNAGIDD